ncbi:MAG: 2-C-methyl-D-erythritol 2,4-cyclodiphosphate synthase [Nitrospirae bacterium RIFOXYB2_FULL_43_5]|nr:MAG: 2-C-methyl-D-erythritol 2,4-cyclodiphosphate synthase [Nitrospirae bacterium GWF2_44_13]OGW33123.1 MAG: 2-C-methyl-D-erythritol 2,4-cyclodiphosphate synthase [Nitrospirae bacterium GWD2_44_7]OGW65270.1 MAG: 2-C-methyl-D-erythritol 2,4-cyclodiphosphate synthase [Nitrospirae bacterium RIFOXYA2_FULL_44_9]OGW71338.1 MAG: 2-C-methyl-D-erythritol 2,4-cyclodiphosphate synthase [Nitrospirae bacterium RIFOXYC2_FULL_44_7]OGW72924.1 MAG: 2-C-methyl-D-erythritol 2,4-cyclodiphosphate synthase [Nitro
MRTGFGYDSHRLIKRRKLIIGGAEIPFEKGLAGHSDADVLCHAIIDSLIGALGLGDIGKHFSDTEPAWKDASSIALLKNIIEMVNRDGFKVLWIDSTIIAERPRLSPYIDSMKKALSGAGIPPELINIKAKTNEGMGFTGRGEGIAAYAVCLLRKI